MGRHARLDQAAAFWGLFKVGEGVVSKTGYTTGVFDVLHVGHVRLLQRARQHCDRLIVGVASDELCRVRKGLSPVQHQDERQEIVRSLRCVDDVVLQEKFDNIADWERYRFDLLFKGDDWKEHPDWIALEARMAPLGVRIVFLPYTQGISSTLMRKSYVPVSPELRLCRP